MPANNEIITAAFDKLKDGDTSLWLDAMADNIRYDFVGGDTWNKIYEDTQAFIEGLGRVVVAKMAPPLRLKVKRIIDAGDDNVVEFVSDQTTRTGKPYSNRYCMILRMEGGKIVDLVEYCDTWRVVTELGERVSSNT
jgi:ketosteroid isomerase-like protein